MPTAAQTTATLSTAPISVTVLMSASRRSPADRFPAARQLFFGSPPAPRPTRRGPSNAPSPAPARRASGRADREPSPAVHAVSLRGPCARPSHEPCTTRPGATSTALHAAAARPPRPASCSRRPPARSSACMRLSTASASPSRSPRPPAPRALPAPSIPCSLPSSPSTLNVHGGGVSRTLAERAAWTAFEKKWKPRCPGVVRSLTEGGDELLTFFRYPKGQWKTIRTTNVIERLNEEFRRRVKTQAHCLAKTLRSCCSSAWWRAARSNCASSTDSAASLRCSACGCNGPRDVREGCYKEQRLAGGMRRVFFHINQDATSEIGTDVSRFPSAGHLISWAGLCPGNDESAGKRRSTHLREGGRWLKATLVQSAWSASRTKGFLLQSTVLSHPSPPRTEEGGDRRGGIDADRGLPHAPDRRGVRGPQRELLCET